jgi:hypothetical protein
MIATAAANSNYTKIMLDAPGALCLDGSAGALYYRAGHGTGANNFYGAHVEIKLSTLAPNC